MNVIASLSPKAIQAIDNFSKIEGYAFQVFFILIMAYMIINLAEAAWMIAKGDLAEGWMSLIQPIIMCLFPSIALVAYKAFGVF